MLMETLGTADMSSFITALTTNLTPAALWNELAGIAPYLGVMIVFAFGFRIVLKLIKKAPKGKVL